MYVDTSFFTIPNGIKIKLYRGYPFLHMQFSKKVEYIHYPQWYYNIEYLEEKQRGYDYHEDLMVPGYFEVALKKGESLIFSASLNEEKTRSLKPTFIKELKTRKPLKKFSDVLRDAGQQFIIKKGTRTELNAGYPWFGAWGRDTFISLPGLTLPQKDYLTFHAVIKTMINRMRGPLFPNTLDKNYAAFNSVDAPLWFIWALQQLAINEGSTKNIWSRYQSKIKNILNGYRQGTNFNIHMTENGLIYQGDKGMALTWMDAMVDGVPVISRYGWAVEINALWFNAISFALEAALENSDNKFLKFWKNYPEKIKHSFIDTFWKPSKGYLADVVNNEGTDWSIRPNQVFAVSLPYSPLTDEIKWSVMDTIEKELLTPRGLRTLSPSDSNYHPKYKGNQPQRDIAYHQGTVWPWLFGHFAEAYLKLHEYRGVYKIEQLLYGFEKDLSDYGIGTISEIYDGDPPHKQRGAISQAWSVAELLRVETMLQKYKKE
ncbi:MAG TPA: amylo-alpha-1,6-glucosidase [Bacteroidales bacterium]|nr:amylo-alpha-1,6-glucosidase [Bacteroidales bacterium]